MLLTFTPMLRFQSTLPVRGATHDYFTSALPAPQFQSTLPVRGATTFNLRIDNGVLISIHAPRKGSD